MSKFKSAEKNLIQIICMYEEINCMQHLTHYIHYE